MKKNRSAVMAALIVEGPTCCCVFPEPILAETRRNLYDGVSQDELSLAPVFAARTLIETDPNYSKVSARLLNDRLRREALSYVFRRPEQATQAET